MKILKKLLLVGLCSFCFCISANALTNSNNVIIPTFLEEVEYHYALSVNSSGWVFLSYCNDNESYLASPRTNDPSSEGFYTNLNKCVSSQNGVISDSIIYSLKLNGSMVDLDDIIVFSDDLIDLSNAIKGSKYSSSLISFYGKENRLGLRSDGKNLIYNSTNSSIINQPVIHTNRDIYELNDSGDLDNIFLSVSVFEEEIEENICDRTAVLGAVSNVNEIKLNVKGETNALSDPLKGTFTLNYTSVIVLSEDNFSVEFVNNSDVNVVGNYNFKCSSDSNNCYLNYEYSSMDDIIETIDFSFKIRLSDNGIMPLIKIYACTTNDDYTYISYDYTNGPSDSTTNNPSLDNILTDSTPPDISGFGDMSGWLPPGPVDSILTIPLTMLNSITNFLSGTCTPVKYTLPYINYETELPCMNTIYEKINATTFFELTGTIASTIILISYFTFLYNWLDDILRLEHKKVKAWGAGEV